jgi:elongation factor 1-gamma
LLFGIYFYILAAIGSLFLYFTFNLPKAEEAAIAALKRALTALNTHLSTSTYLVGHSLTLADIVLTCNLTLGFSRLLTKTFTSEFPHVERYFWTMVNQPNFHKILGEVKQTESVPPVQKPSQQKEPAKPKEPAIPKAKEEPKKETKKESAKPKAEEAGEAEEAPKPKPKNPLDLLPPSKMILDEWKRLYSNTKTNFREVAIKGSSAKHFPPFFFV